MKKSYLITVILAGTAFVTACNSGNIRRNPGKTYAPDMVYSQAYDAYTANPVTANGLTSQAPVPGTIARGQAIPLHLEESDTAAFKALSFPYDFSAADIEEGGRLYNIYCGICHGAALDGNGPLYSSGKFAAMPANLVSGGEYYTFMAPGKIYHAIMYGKNMMGSYSSQLNEKERWQVIAYIKQFQSQNGGAPFTMGQDGSEAATSAGQPQDTTVSETATAAAVKDSVQAH